MAGTPRSAKVREALEARAKAMRRAGASMAEIERETGVPAPTLHQWAARGGWRLCDLEDERYAAEFGTPDPQGPQGRPPARSVSEDRLSGREGGQKETETPADQRESRGLWQDGALSCGEVPDRVASGSSGLGEIGSRSHGALGPESFLSSGTAVPSVLPRIKSGVRAGGRPCDASGVGEIGSGPLGVSGQNTPDPQGPQGEQPPGASGVHPRAARTRLDGGPGGQEKSGPGALPSPSCLPNPTPENLLTLADTAKAEAMRLFASGQVKRAREYLLTAQRFVVAAGGAKASGEAGHTHAELARAELERRLLKLIPREMARYLKAIAAGEGALEAYLAERDTSRVYKWRDHFWWPDLFAARIAHPPYGFVNENAEDWDGKRPYLNAWLAMVVPDR